MATIYPSLLSANMLDIKEELAALDPYSAGYHIDIMDNHFAPNLGFSFAFTNDIAKQTDRQLWVHLMIDRPERFLDRLSIGPKSIVSVHSESTAQLELVIEQIKAHGWLSSIALSPGTPVDTIKDRLTTDRLAAIDQVLIMSVEPGFSGQQFIESVTTKVDQLVQMRKDQKLTFAIGIDGGVNKDNIGQLAKQGVDDFAVASALFKAPDRVKALQELQELVKEN